MNARAAFEKAQKEYKKTMKELESMKTAFTREHEELMQSVLDGTAEFVTPSSMHKAVRPSKEAMRNAQIQHRDASHKLFERLSTDFRKSKQELLESKSKEDSKEKFLERLADLDPQSLKDFTEEEAKDFESKHGLINPGQSKKDSQDSPQDSPQTPE